eukprot:2190933-Pleurochrysis_carterae.AAC.2
MKRLELLSLVEKLETTAARSCRPLVRGYKTKLAIHVLLTTELKPFALRARTADAFRTQRSLCAPWQADPLIEHGQPVPVWRALMRLHKVTPRLGSADAPIVNTQARAPPGPHRMA